MIFALIALDLALSYWYLERKRKKEAKDARNLTEKTH